MKLKESVITWNNNVKQLKASIDTLATNIIEHHKAEQDALQTIQQQLSLVIQQTSNVCEKITALLILQTGD